MLGFSLSILQANQRNTKVSILAELTKPCLILQGERDTFGKREEFADFDLSDSIRVEFIPDGDHSFKPRKSSGYTEQQNIALTVEKLSAFIKEVLNEK